MIQELLEKGAKVEKTGWFKDSDGNWHSGTALELVFLLPKTNVFKTIFLMLLNHQEQPEKIESMDCK